MNQIVLGAEAEEHYDPDCTADQITAVLAHLGRWSKRTSTHVTHYRSCDRFDYTVEVEIACQAALDNTGAHIRQVLHVQARNVSRSGLGFVAPPLFVPQLLSDTTPFVRTDVAFQQNTVLTVRLISKDSEPIMVLSCFTWNWKVGPVGLA